MRSCREEFRRITWPDLSGRKTSELVEKTLMPSEELQRMRSRRGRKEGE